jgi:hypothetical protein
MGKVNVRLHVGKLEKAQHQLRARNMKTMLAESLDDPHRGARIPDKPKSAEIFSHNRRVMKALF